MSGDLLFPAFLMVGVFCSLIDCNAKNSIQLISKYNKRVNSKLQYLLSVINFSDICHGIYWFLRFYPFLVVWVWLVSFAAGIPIECNAENYGFFLPLLTSFLPFFPTQLSLCPGHTMRGKIISVSTLNKTKEDFSTEMRPWVKEKGFEGALE